VLNLSGVQKPTSVDEYLSWVPADHRPLLDEMRATIRSVAPHAQEVISYGMPAFKLNDRFFCSYSDFKHHVSLFPATEYVRERLGAEVAPYFAGKGTFRFPVDRPLPRDLVGRIVTLLLDEKVGPS
jgi:uncharacterized protein YdhG (YjbR/CyaY superfamily)